MVEKKEEKQKKALQPMPPLWLAHALKCGVSAGRLGPNDPSTDARRKCSPSKELVFYSC